MNGQPTAQREEYERQGFVVARELLPRAEVLALRSYTEQLLRSGRSARVQTAYNRQGGVRLQKVNGLAERDARFRALASEPALVDTVEALVGKGARRFRDVLVVKPARTGGVLSYHQDSAYWDVEPKALVSCWVALGDVNEQASCLRVVPASHHSLAEHGIYLRGRYPLPSRVTRGLRRLVSLAGTGDNPEGAGGSPLAWQLKRLALTSATRYAPVLFDLQDYRLAPAATAARPERTLPVRAGDVIFFHSLLWHASGPNDADEDRYAEIISYMSADARFVGRGPGRFPLARRESP